MSLDDITLENNTRHDLRWLNKEALNKVRAALGIAKPVYYIFIDDEEMLEINKQVLNHDYYTDVITFDYENDDDIEANEILVSVDRVIDNSKTLHTAFKEEMYRVCIHGMLHISGLDDQTEEQKAKIRSEEDRYLNLYCST